MKFEGHANFIHQKSKKGLMKNITIKKAKFPNQNKELLRRATTTRIDLERALYQTDLIWEEEKVSDESEEVFKRSKIGFFKLYYILLEKLDYFYLVLGLIGCLAAGVSTPLIFYLNAVVYSDLGKTSEQRGSMSEEDLMKENVEDSLNTNIKQQIIYGSIALVDNFIGYFFIGIICTRTFYNFKKIYFRLIFSQEQAWFDSTNIFDFATKVQAQFEYYEIGFGDTLVDFVIKICIAIGSLIFAFLGSWKLTLVILCLVLFMIISGVCASRMTMISGVLVREVYESAGGIAEEILYNIKIIISFANFDYELKRYYEKIEISSLLERRAINYLGISLSILFFCQIISVFLGLIYGRTLIKNDYNSVFGRDTSGGDISLTFNCVVTLISSLVDILNDLGDINESLSVTSDFFNLYERKPQIDLTNSIEKPPLSNIRGNIEFKNVSFYYPSDENKKLVLDNINLSFIRGKKVALIGESGSGKTTIANLIERLYERTEGEILLDGLDICKYDIQYLRNLIGYCEQEPILFNRSIRDNIIFGREEYIKELNLELNQLVQTACEEAYVTEFLDRLPGGLDYIVGIKGGKLSGGQKQRIAIARAILTKPKILILDEATSALDNKSEQIVQKALDNISKRNITTIIIAHKMSTIKNSDLIYVLKDGKVYEQGNHEELIQKGGYYEKTIRAQLLSEELNNHNNKDEYIKKMTSMKRTNTDEEIHFERRDEELSLSPENVEIKLSKVFKTFWIYKSEVIFSVLFTIAYGALSVIRAFFSGKGTVALTSDYETVRYDEGLKYSIIFLIVGTLHTLSYYSSFYFLYMVGIDVTKSYRNFLLKKYLSLHIAFFDIDRNSPGSLLSRMAIDTVQLMFSIKLIIGNLIASLANLVTTLIMGVCYEYRITLATIAFLPFIIIITIIRRFTVQVDSPKSLAAGAEGGRILSECVISSKTIFSYNFSQKALFLYLQVIDYITQKLYRDNFINAFCLSLMIFCDYIINIIIFSLSKRYILNGSLDSDEMTVIQYIVIEGGFNTISSFMKSIWRLRKSIASIRSLYSILDTESLISPLEKDNINKISANNIKGKIEFRNVYFAYPFHPENVILKNISFTILPGQKVALVGNSGCGKSSVIQLINRFYDLEDGKGEVLIDDINIKNYNLYELKKKIGFVQQEPSAFKRSNLENIRYGNLDATDEQCYEAAKKVNALNILEKDKGQNAKEEKLTGGDKQKLAIARIFLKNPTILLLDEPTSALDKESEAEIEKSLEILSENKTTITIAHRLNTIENYDKIIVLDKGRIKEEGTHEELMKLRKRYYAFHKFSNLN